MPRLTYCPSRSSAAVRAASSSRVRAISTVLLPCRRYLPVWSLAHRLPLDSFDRVGAVHHPMHMDSRSMHLRGVDVAGFDQVLDLGDGDPPGRRALRVEVGRGLPVDQVAVPIAEE